MSARTSRSSRGSRSTAGDLECLNAVELFASAITVGLSPREAALAVVDTLSPSPATVRGAAAIENRQAAAGGTRDMPTVAAYFLDIAELYRLGADARSAWSGVDGTALQPLAHAVRRAEDTGTPLIPAVTECATALREEHRRTLVASAERAGVLIAGPLALCFLPAFVLLGMVPVVAGMLRGMGLGVP